MVQGLAYFALFLLICSSLYVVYKNHIVSSDNSFLTTTTDENRRETVNNTDSTSDTLEREVVVLEDEPDAIIGPGESATVQCGDGNMGTRTSFARGSFSGNIGKGDQVEIPVQVLDSSLQPAGGMVRWSLFYWGSLAIKGCTATYTAPDSIGTAYSVSATINTKIDFEPTPIKVDTSVGEGGPTFVGFVTTTKVTILSGATTTCHNPAGVSISINSVPTTSVVQIRVDTPKFLGRVYNGRNTTVKDGPGDYYIQIFVNNNLYDETTSAVAECQLPNVRF